MNKVFILGRLGRDPEIKYTQAGTSVVNLNVATDESFTDQQGQKQERTEWHKVVAFGRQADTCGKYLSKGSQVLIEGSLQTQKWQDQQGNNRYTTQIKALRVQFLSKPQGQNQNQGQQQSGPVPQPDPGPMDDIPF